MTGQVSVAKRWSRWSLVLLGFLCLRDLAAQELPAHARACLAQIRSEVAFITSRVELINQEFEAQLRADGLVEYSSGQYSTGELLDHSIRKYRLNLVEDLQRYPQHYRQQAKAGRLTCPAEQLKWQGIGIIRDFERHWWQTLETARHNARYFRQLENMQ